MAPGACWAFWFPPFGARVGSKGAFDPLEGFMCLLTADGLQPLGIVFAVRRIPGHHESIGNDDEGAIGAGVTHPAEIFVVDEPGVVELAVRPVTHRVEGATPLHDLLG